MSIEASTAPNLPENIHGDGMELDSEARAIAARGGRSTFARIAKYLLVRIASILVTIFAGIFVTVLIANHTGMIDATVRSEVEQRVYSVVPQAWCWGACSYDPETQAAYDAAVAKFSAEAGLNLPFLPRHLLWTVKALGLGLGRNIRISGAPGSYYTSAGAANIILSDLPHTLMLIGMAFTLLFVIGIPLALYLFRKHGSFLDRLFTLLAPVSSIPSWVLGVVLILILAVGLKVLPAGGMYDTVPPKGVLDEILIVLKHMILPVGAILMSLFFQCIYAWKTFFMQYATEDYVELGKAKGMENERFERQYILKPTLPYIITNFTLLLVSFWQMTMALEKIINWPGIGRLYINSLPNFLGESMFPGVMPVVVGIVVIFAYILGVTVLVLDVVYALVDPRVRIGTENETVQPVKSKRRVSREEERMYKEWTAARRAAVTLERRPVIRPAYNPFSITVKPTLSPVKVRQHQRAHQQKGQTRKTTRGIKPVLREIAHYPTAIFGLAIILLLVCGSVVAVTVFPYNQLAGTWAANELTGKSYVPKLAKPLWINWFRKEPLPSSFSMDSSRGDAQEVSEPFSNGLSHQTQTFSFDFPYGDFPQDVSLYFTTDYQIKRPFVTLKWLTPDGRELVLDNFSPQTGIAYQFNRSLPVEKLLPEYPHWQDWFIVNDYNATPKVNLLFADPGAGTAKVQKGIYKLVVEVINFEPTTSVKTEMVLLGQTFGWAGTDYMRRDLLVPLLWGMPFALALGLVGASLTTLVSMILAAAGVYLGGWIDNLVQRLIEGVMILPVVAIGVILYAYYNMSIWTFLALIALLNVFGSPTKSFRAALLQIKDSPYVEWARASGAGNLRIVVHYLLPNILPMLVPQMVALIPSYVFLEATLGIFNIKSIYPTWGKVIYEALKNGAVYGSGYWVLEPIFLLLLTGLAFAMLGFALERILNPRLRDV